jgi:hypothetical protein
MPPKEPKSDGMLPIDRYDHTLEVDMRYLLAERPELKAELESAGADSEYDLSTEYEDPRIGAALTATQVLKLLNVGK